MAEGESNRMQLFRELRQKFPEIPDSVFNDCFHQYSHDLQKCIDFLKKVSSRYLYGPMENLQISKQESSVSTNHYKSSSHAYHYSHKHNNPNIGHEPELKQNDSYQYQMHNIQVGTEGETRYVQGSSLRSTSMSGTPTGSKSFAPNNVDYASLNLHPQSAPVVSRSFEPFHFIGHTQFSFNRNNQPPSGFSNTKTHHQLPVCPETVYDPQRGLFFNQCNYEMHVSYNEGMSSSSGVTQYSISSSIPHAQAYVNNQKPTSEPVRHTTSLNITPVNPHFGFYLHDPSHYSQGGDNSHRLHSTTVNLQLRPPSSTPHPQIQINTSGGKLVYSSTAGSAQEPFKSHVHISISPAGSSFSAVRTRVRAMPNLQSSLQTEYSVESTPSSNIQFTTSHGANFISNSKIQQPQSSAFPNSHPYSEFASKVSFPKNSARLEGSKCKSCRPESGFSLNLFSCNNPEQGRKIRTPVRPIHSPPSYVQNMNGRNGKAKRTVQNSSGDSLNEVAYVQALVRHQHAQLQNFKQELFTKNYELDILKQEVGALEQQLVRKQQTEQNLPPYVKDIRQLKESIRKLRTECDFMSKEVDFIVKDQVPLGETSEDFYRHINPGQTGSVGNPPIHGDQAAAQLPPPSPSSSEVDDESHHWGCTACTFLNNPALDKCEICEMPRILIGTPHVLLPVHSGPCYCHKQTVP